MRLLLGTALLACLVQVSGAADKTSSVTGASFPSPAGFSLNGSFKPVLTLVRGHRYEFVASVNNTIHPFKLTTIASGGAGTSIYTNLVQGAQPACSGCGNTSFVFAPDATTPDRLYYQCNVHANMGNEIRVVDPPRHTQLGFSNGFIGVTFTNAYHTTATVQRATDLFANDWVTIQTVTAAPGPVELAFTNDAALHALRVVTPLP